MTQMAWLTDLIHGDSAKKKKRNCGNKVLIYKRCKISEIHYYSVEKVAILALSQEERRSSYLVTIEISVFIQNCDLINSYQRSGDRPDLW